MADEAQVKEVTVNKFTIKKIMLFVCALLLVIGLVSIYAIQPANGSFLKQARGGWGGPCWDLNNDCGDVGGGMGTCAWDGMGCTGQCTSYCPSGSPDEYCVGLYGSCTTNAATCSTMETRSCQTSLFGPPHCDCVSFGLGGRCSRNNC